MGTAPLEFCAFRRAWMPDRRELVFFLFFPPDGAFCGQWLDNLARALDGAEPDYLIVQHMEPDHSANIFAFAERYPSAKIVASSRAFQMMKNFFGTEFADRRVIAEEGSVLETGKHRLTFLAAPMVHWPEVIMTYDERDHLLFSADAFGKFGALDCEEDWACEARRYYFGIVGKYGVQVQNLLKKLSGYAIKAILPLHGPVLTENLAYYLRLYHTWSSYGVESEGVMIAYTSVYGNTKQAVELLEQALIERGCEKVVVTDLARCDLSEAVEDAFRYGTLVLATTTYNGEIFPPMRAFISSLTERNYQNRRIGLIENGSWAPVAARVMRTMLEGCKNLQFLQTSVKIVSALNEDSHGQVLALAEELMERREGNE